MSRYTYAALNESRTDKIALFKDDVDESGKTNQVNRSASLREGHRVVCLASLLSPGALEDAADAPCKSELVGVRADG